MTAPPPATPAPASLTPPPISAPVSGSGDDTRLTVVGIGASAGGLRALQQFMEAVPVDSGHAYVVIMHLDPDRESRMSELLQDRAAIPVTQVSEPVRVEANHIYMIPPGHDLTIREGRLELRPRGDRADHAPVDLFFRTLAEACGEDAVGVILSGTGVDGTAGIRSIREAGGVTIAQSPDESSYDGMPTSAISTGFVDLVLPSAQIPTELIRLRRRPRRAPGGVVSPLDDEAALTGVFTALRNRTGHDFSMYRRTTVLRRLDRRLRFNNVATLAEYQPLLESSATESQALLRDLLISVSSFFRDPEAFEALAEQIPSLFAGRGPGDRVRVWVVGCATGEEVYSIAMLLAEYASTLAEPPQVQLFATDIDDHGYGWARAGLYSAAALSGVTPGRIARFFTKEANGYRVVKSLRELVLFAGHNVLHDPPFSRMDLVSCRNLFIYLQPEAQQHVLEIFHFATNPEGLLFLGASESAGDSGLFTPANGATQRIFRRSATPYRVMPRLSAADPQQPGVSPDAEAATHRTQQARRSFSYGSLHVRMLEQYAPASMVVNDRMEAVHLSAGAGRFLHPTAGEPSHNVLFMTTGALRKALRTGLHHAFESDESTKRQVQADVNGKSCRVSVQVRPSGDEGSRFALVIFEVLETAGGVAPSTDGAVASVPPDEGEEELRRTRELLESATEAHDRTVAELQTVNEELQSINEEQKAATEELETGREEIQSINEELTTINQEHRSTIEELKRTNEDLQNLIESTEIGTVFLDRAMRIRRFTPAASAIFNFVQTDQGRPLSHITHRIRYDHLQEDVASVLTTLECIEREVECENGDCFIMRINPYRALDGTTEGAVLTFFDNTGQHRAREELNNARLAAESANMVKATFLSTLSHEFRTPLNGILGYADLLTLEDLTPSQEQKVARIRAGGWHLAAMIEEILSFARLDGGHEVVAPGPMDARLLAREAVALVEPAALAKGLTFELDVPEERADIVTDLGKARQILINLCSNAVKYTDEGSVRLLVRRTGGGVCFEVSDTGIGIAEEHVSRIFERFWQVNGGSTRAAGGMGIGLAAAREYAQLLRGDIDVESTLGVGSTFRLWLPERYERR